MASQRSKSQESGTLRNASDPYIIHLSGEPYTLTTGLLQEQAEANLPGKRTWSRPFLKFISYESDTLVFEARHYRNDGFVITIYIEPDKLHVSCSCGMQVEKLCIHALMALEKIIMLEGSQYFERYQPNGMVETGFKYPKWFEKSIHDLDLAFKPKKNFGSVYSFEDKKSTSSFASICYLPGPSTPDLLNQNMVMTYILMFPRSYRQKTPLFLMPCSAIENKAGTDIKFFNKFLSGAEKSNETSLTVEQTRLNMLCFQMWKQAENTNGRFLENNQNDRVKLEALFGLWGKAVPYLIRQEYVLLHPFFHVRHLKGKPKKSYVDRIRIKKERPKLCFQLTDKGDYYQLCLKADIGGKTITKFNSDAQFFIRCDGYCYFAASLRDAAILQWMSEMDNRLNIFKAHFQQFEKEYLNFLLEHYPVERV